MGCQIIKQPNGKYALFSNNVDDFVATNMTPELPATAMPGSTSRYGWDGWEAGRKTGYG